MRDRVQQAIERLVDLVTRHPDRTIDLVVAATSVALTLMTFSMVRSTRIMTRATQTALFSSVHPLLVPSTEDELRFVGGVDQWSGIRVTQTVDGTDVELTFVNIGAGVGIVTSASFSIAQHPPRSTQRMARHMVRPGDGMRVDGQLLRVARHVVRPGESTRVEGRLLLTAPYDASSPESLDDIEAAITYVNVLGKERTTSRVTLSVGANRLNPYLHGVKRLNVAGEDRTPYVVETV